MGLVRFIFILVGVIMALLFWQRINQKIRRRSIDPLQEDSRLGRLVPCAACATYIDQKTAHVKRHEGVKGFFCDAECAKVGFVTPSQKGKK